MPLFEIQDEYHDKMLGRRVGKGEQLELSADRLKALGAIGVRAVPIREQPAETAAALPAEEKAVKTGGTRKGRT